MSTELGSLLRKLRGKQSLREISKISGTSHTYLSVIEKGVDPRTGNPIKPTPHTLKILSKTYSYSYEELMKISGYLYEGHADPSSKLNEIQETYTANHTALNEKIELERVLKQADVAFKGKGLSPSERKKVLDMLTLLFHETTNEEKDNEK